MTQCAIRLLPHGTCAPRQAQLAADITALLERLNIAGPDSLIVPGEYLEAVIVRK